ncbi:methionyl-tRNA formyltransferase [Anoxybacterium hadale]|uniref:methionyl-tRNA formyltransferase n=1 Tax=Anoxybacterium hadale TaxID=3408580 RepID=UPI003B00CB9B
MMNKNGIKIVYMGTPEFAVPPLKSLCESGYQVELVVTQPDKARDRGKKVQFPPVKETALQYGVEVLQPEKIKGNEEFFNRIREIKPDLIIVAAYGKLLPLELLEIPELGCINIHASLLPKYRGAAPIHRCIIEGEKTTGITLMYMEEGLDTGDMIASRFVDVEDKNTAQLHEELSVMGAELLMDTLPNIMNGTAGRTKQDDSMASYAPMVFKQDGLIDFGKSPEEIERLIRGLNSWPVAHTLYLGETMKIWEAKALDEKSAEPCGTIRAVSNEGIKVSAGGRSLMITKLQMPGKRAMQVSEYLKGNKIEIGEVLG